MTNEMKGEMRAIALSSFGGADSLKLVRMPGPVVAAGSVLVRNNYAAVNPIDAKTRAGEGVPVNHFPAVLGWDLCGTVVQTASDVTTLKEGDVVFGMAPFPEIAGCYAEYVAVPASALARIPETVERREAAGAAMASLAAWQALFPFCGPLAGLRVLIHGGAGGVGHIAVQLARVAGAEVIATGSGESRALLTDLGAKQVVDYKRERFEDVLHDLDVVIDTRGGGDYPRLLKTLKPTGIIVSLLGREQGQNQAEATRRGIRAGFVYVKADGLVLQRIGQYMADKTIRVLIDRQFTLAEVAEAHKYIETGHARGRVLLDIGG